MNVINYMLMSLLASHKAVFVVMLTPTIVRDAEKNGCLASLTREVSILSPEHMAALDALVAMYSEFLTDTIKKHVGEPSFPVTEEEEDHNNNSTQTQAI